MRVKQHDEVNLLARFWQTWTGEANPGTAFADLESFLSATRGLSIKTFLDEALREKLSRRQQQNNQPG